MAKLREEEEALRQAQRDEKFYNWGIKDFAGKYHRHNIASKYPVPGSQLLDEADREVILRERKAQSEKRLEKVEADRERETRAFAIRWSPISKDLRKSLGGLCRFTRDSIPCGKTNPGKQSRMKSAASANSQATRQMTQFSQINFLTRFERAASPSWMTSFRRDAQNQTRRASPTAERLSLRRAHTTTLRWCSIFLKGGRSESKGCDWELRTAHGVAIVRKRAS